MTPRGILKSLIVGGLLAFALTIWLASRAHAAEQIPCWKVQAALAWSLGNEAKAEKLARRHGYTKAQIAEAKERCRP
jgi:hypothetical protein